jgi:hypothetical protein
LKILSEKNLYGVYQTCLAPDPDITVAHGLNAAFALKARSMDIRGGKVLVLIDPVAPPGVTSEKTPTIEAVREERSNMREKLWAKWGIGKKPGHADPDSDIGAEGYERLIERYEFVQPGYWASARTGFQGGLGISAGALLKDLPVLIVGTPNRSGQQRRNEAELIKWLEGKHCRVERMELDELGLEGIGGLPMAGDHSQKIFDEIVRWGQATIRSMPAPAEEESR